MNRKQLAEYLDVSPRTIGNWRRDGIIPGPDERGRYDLQAVARALVAYRQQCQDRSATADRHADVRAQIEEHRLAKMRAENARMMREYVPVELVVQLREEIVRVIRDHLDELVANIRARIPHIRAAEVEQIRREVSKVSNAIVNTFDPARR